MMPCDYGAIVVPSCAQMRCEQNTQTHIWVAALKVTFDGEDIALRIGRYPQTQYIAGMGVHNLESRHARSNRANAVIAVPLDFRPEPFSVGNNESQVADLGNIYSRPVDLVDDAIAQGEP